MHHNILSCTDLFGIRTFATFAHFSTISHPPFTKRTNKTSTGEVISGVLKARKEEGCSLQAYNLLKRNSIRYHFERKPTG